MVHNHLVHPASCACGKSELELFSVPPTQTAIESSQWVEYRPITTLSDSSPIEFVITGSGEEYVDLSESYLQVTAKILKTNGGDLAQTKGADGTVTGDDADVGPVNLWLHSLFSQVDVSLNERLVTPSMNTYPYRAYLETLFSYGPADKESYLTAAMWYKDTAKHMEDHQLNKGFKSRQEWSLDSKQVVIIGRPHLDLCFQDCLKLNGVDIKMRLVKSKDAFSLMGEGKVKIEDVALFVRKVKVDPSVQLDHIRGLERMSAKYPLCRLETKVFSVPKHNMMANQENLFLGLLPNRMVIGMVENTVLTGQGQESLQLQTLWRELLGITCGRKTNSCQTTHSQVWWQIVHEELCIALHRHGFYGAWSWQPNQSWQIRRRVHTVCFRSDARSGWGWTFPLGETGKPQTGIVFCDSIAGNHQRDRVCGIWQRHRSGQSPQRLVRLLGMNSQQLVSILKQDRYTAPLFHGVYPINCLPSIWDGVYVVNTAPHNHPGLHWIALFVKDGTIEYFDSYGGDPPSTLRRWGKKKRWMSNPIPLQSPLTSVCGRIVYTICFTVLGGSIWPPCSWISVLMWMTTTNWSMILWKIVTTWNI